MPKRRLQEGRDFEINERGDLVFTALYLLERGECCGSGCKNCPFNFCNVPEPQKTNLQVARKLLADQSPRL